MQHVIAVLEDVLQCYQSTANIDDNSSKTKFKIRSYKNALKALREIEMNQQDLKVHCFSYG